MLFLHNAGRPPFARLSTLCATTTDCPSCYFCGFSHGLEGVMCHAENSFAIHSALVLLFIIQMFPPLAPGYAPTTFHTYYMFTLRPPTGAFTVPLHPHHPR